MAEITGYQDFGVDLAEQLSDQRSNEIAYKLSITNRGTGVLNLLSITPFLPASVSLTEAKRTSFLAMAERRDDITKELDELLQAAMEVEASALTARVTEIRKKALLEMTSVSGFMKFYFKLFSGRLTEEWNDRLRRERAFGFTVQNYDDGVKARVAFVDGSSLPEPLKQLYGMKLERLQEVQKLIDSGDGSSAVLATIRPASTFSTAYILSFKRGLLSGRKYNVSFEVVVAEGGKAERQVNVASASLLISPQGYALNIIVVFAALIGLVLKAAALDPKLRAAAMQVQTDPATLAWAAAESVIVALVFFNAFEFTNLADRVRMALNWRSALLIGVASALVSDRVVSALQAFLK